jgi:prepilin-type N-terminal cleavage/methylation domain-containing protein
MLHTFTKKGLRGFTLIELLVVIAIIGLLSTVIAAPITEARKKGRDAKKIADMRSIVTALGLYYDDNGGNYPVGIDGLVPRYLSTLPSGAATTTTARDKYMYAVFTDSGPAKRIAYHLGVKLESANQALNDDADCGGAESALSGTSKPCVSSAGAATPGSVPSCSGIATCTATYNNFASGDAGVPTGSATGDFGGGIDSGTSTCTAALNTCIYDLAN